MGRREVESDQHNPDTFKINKNNDNIQCPMRIIIIEWGYFQMSNGKLKINIISRF